MDPILLLEVVLQELFGPYVDIVIDEVQHGYDISLSRDVIL